MMQSSWIVKDDSLDRYTWFYSNRILDIFFVPLNFTYEYILRSF